MHVRMALTSKEVCPETHRLVQARRRRNRIIHTQGVRVCGVCVCFCFLKFIHSHSQPCMQTCRIRCGHFFYKWMFKNKRKRAKIAPEEPSSAPPAIRAKGGMFKKQVIMFTLRVVFVGYWLLVVGYWFELVSACLPACLSICI